MRRVLAVPVVVMAAAGCRLGPELRDYPFVQGPEGVGLQASLGSKEAIAGELLEVQDGGLLVLTSSDAGSRWVTFVPFGEVVFAKFGRLGGGYELAGGQPPTDETRRRLQAVSRFPQGVSDVVLKRLLEAHGQPEVAQVRR